MILCVLHQVILLAPCGDADVQMLIFNADGSEAGACGNATRCVTSLWLSQHPHLASISIRTRFGDPANRRVWFEHSLIFVVGLDC
jgi:diaminopimelate epimerase